MEQLVLQGVLLLLTLAYLWNWYKKQRLLHKYVDAFPGDTWYPLVGTNWRFLMVPREERWALIKKLCRQYGPSWRIWSAATPMVFLSKVEHVEIVFKSNVNLNKGDSYRYVLPWLGHGLITAPATKWKANRKIMTPAFHFKVLDKYSEVFSSKAQELVKIFEKSCGTDEYIDVFPYLTRCGLDIIAETAMGIKFDTLKDPDSDYANSIFNLCTIAIDRISATVTKNDFIFSFTKLGKVQEKSLKIVKGTNLKIISERRARFQKEKHQAKTDDIGIKEKLAFLDILLENQEENRFTDDEICDEVSTFMFAGQDTTAVTVAYTILALGNNPDIQAKVHEELDSIFNGEDRPITPQDVADMEYLDRVVKETLRKFSIVPLVGRLLDEAIVIDGKTLPPGVTVELCLYEIHHNPEHWPDPDKYDPDRFLPENAKNRHPYAFVPFSAGPRNCIGQKFGTRNSKTMLAALFRKFKISSLETLEQLKQYHEIVLKPQNGIRVKFESRHKK